MTSAVYKAQRENPGPKPEKLSARTIKFRKLAARARQRDAREFDLYWKARNSDV
jgi:hypothetical protein